MPTVTVPRSNVTIEEVSDALRQWLGTNYNILPATARNWNPVGNPRPDHPNSIVVGTGSARLFRAEVTLSESPGHTELRVAPGGISLPVRLLNRTVIARKVHKVLQAAPGLR
jgi:hypothetical protein